MSEEERAISYYLSLLDIPLYYYLISIILFLIILFFTTKINVSLLVSYAFMFLAATVLDRTPFEGQHFQPELFWSYGVWSVQCQQVIANIIVFIPFGLVSAGIWRSKGILYASMYSAFIEVLQLVTSRGLCEFDDIVHNTLGAVIGFAIYMLIVKIVEIVRIKMTENVVLVVNGGRN